MLSFEVSDWLAPTVPSQQLVLLASVALATCYFTYSVWFHPLASVPGPLQARLGLGYVTTRTYKRDVGWTLHELHQHYGPIVRVGRNLVSIADPEAIPLIYRHGGAWEKTLFYNWFRGPDFENLFSVRNNAHHAAMRRVDAPAYTTNYLVSLQRLVDPVVEDLVDLLTKRVQESPSGTATFLMTETLQLVAMDTIGELAYGRSFGFLKAAKDTLNFFPTMDALTYASGVAGTQPRLGLPFFLGALLRSGVPVTGPEKTLGFNLQLITERVGQINDARANGGNDREDMTSKFLSSRNVKGNPRTITDVAESAAAVLTAGTDTTAITMRALLRYIIEDKRVYARVLEEIDEAFESRGSSTAFSYAEGCTLEYFQVCLKEALRLHPAVQMILPRVVPTEGAVLCGHFLPAGVEVGISPFVIHRSTVAFGPDALVFRPERWLEADEAGKKMLDRNHIPFGAGSRTCVGKNISLMEITKVFPSILHNFKFAFTSRSPSSPHKLPGRGVDGRLDQAEPWHVKSAWFSPQYDFWVDVQSRQHV